MDWLKKCFLSFVFLCQPVSAHAVDLIHAYSDALNHDPVLLAAKERLKETGELVPQAYAVLLPNANLNGSAAKTRIKGAGIAGTQNRHEHFVSFEVTQSLIDLASWFNVGQAKSSVKRAQADYLAVAQNVITRTASAYFAILEAQDFLRFTEAEVKAFAQELEQARERHKVGIDPITNVYDAQARFDSARSREIRARNEIQNRFEDLRAITGVRYQRIDKIRENLPLIRPNPDNINAWEDTAREYNFSIKAQEFALDAAKSNVKVQRAGHYPTLQLFTNAEDIFISRAGAGTFKTDNQEANIGVRLSLNVLAGGAVQSRTRAANYARLAVLQDLENAHRTAAVQTRQQYNNVVATISQIKANRQAIISAESSYKSNQESFKVGTRTILDVLDSLQELTQAQQIHASSQYAYFNSRLALKEAAGILTISDLEEINSWLVHPTLKPYHAKGTTPTTKMKQRTHSKHKASTPHSPDINVQYSK